MSKQITGILKAPSGATLINQSVGLVAIRSTPPSIVKGAKVSFITDASGFYDVDIENGYFRVTAESESGGDIALGTIYINGGGSSDLPTLLSLREEPDTPVNDALQALADSAAQSALEAQQAADSIDPSDYAAAGDVLTPVPAGAVFTDTKTTTLTAHGSMFEPDASNDLTTPATVANQFTVKAGQYRVNGTLIDLPATVVTLPAAPDGTQTYDSETGEFIQHADSATAFAAENLMVNGDFSNSDINGWYTTAGSSVITWDSGRLKAEKVGTGSSWLMRSVGDSLSIPCKAGQKFTVSVDIDKDAGNTGGNPGLSVWQSHSSNDGQVGFLSRAEAAAGKTITATADGRLELILTQGIGSVVGDIYYMDNIVIKSTNKVITSRKDLIYLQEDGSIGVHEGTNDNPTMADAGFSAVSGEAGLWVNGGTYATPLVSVQRRNFGGYHPAVNPLGCSVLRTDSDTNAPWYSATVSQSAVTTEDTFAASSAGSSSGVYRRASGGSIASGGASRPDSKFYDAIYTSDILDLRLQAKAPSATQLEPNYWQNKAVAGTLKNFANEGIPKLVVKERGVVETGSTIGAGSAVQVGDDANYSLGDFVIVLNQNNDLVVAGFCTTPVANKVGLTTTFAAAFSGVGQSFSRTNGDIYTILKVEYTEATGSENTWTDIIGDPANYPRQWTGVIDHQSSDGSATRSAGQTIHVDELTTGIGTIGNVYLYLGAELVGDLRVPNYTNTANWLNLGTKAEFLANATGVEGFPLLYGENGEVITGGPTDVKLSRKYTDINLSLRSDDIGTTWHSPATSEDSTANTVGVNTSNTVLISYTTPAHIFSDDINSEVLGGKLGDVVGASGSSIAWGSVFVSNLIRKVPDSVQDVRRLLGWILDRYLQVADELSTSTNAQPYHSSLWTAPPNNNNRCAKALPYLHTDNNEAQLNVVFKEMVYDTTWGDDNTFTVTDNTSTELDDNSNIVLVGTKSTKLPLVVGG